MGEDGDDDDHGDAKKVKLIIKMESWFIIYEK